MNDYRVIEECDSTGKWIELHSPNDLVVRLGSDVEVDHAIEFAMEMNSNLEHIDWDDTELKLERVRDIVWRYSAMEGPIASQLLEDLERAIR